MDSNTFSDTNRRLPPELLFEALNAARLLVWEWDLGTQRVISSSTLPHLPHDQSVVEFQSMVHPDDREIYDRRLGGAILDQQPFTLEHRIILPDGEIRWHSLSGRVVIDKDGNAGKLIGISQDITDRKLAEQARQSSEQERRLSEALREADRRKDEFLATLAHELRNPLAPIRSSLQFLRMSAASDPEALRAHEILEQQVAQMVRLVDDLLEISRIAGGKVELRREHVDLEGIIRQAIETSRPLIDAAGHSLEVDMADGPLRVEADAARMAQVIANILNNAAKYTESGGTIRLRTGRDNDQAIIMVSDNGVGIAGDMLPRVFDMFAQVGCSMQQAQGGLGIGLSLARSLVELHGGTIEARSDGPGLGSEFIVRLPIDPVVPEARPAVDPLAHTPAPLTRKRILVVDDHRDGADSLAMLLKLLGGETEVAYDGPSAIDAIDRFEPEVVLLDIGMPGMDGYEVARLLRQRPRLASLRLIALTGWGQQEDRVRTSDAGFDEHWVKPVDPAQLRALVGREG